MILIHWLTLYLVNVNYVPEAQEIIQKQVTELSNDVAPLKEALAGDENGVLRIQTLYVG